MKYIRLYEETILEPKNHKFGNKLYYKIYWLLPTDDRFKDSLNKINCNKEYIRDLLTSPVYRENLFIFIGYDGSTSAINDRVRWGWCAYEGTLKNEFYEEERYKFGGAINIEDYELKANKYNL